MNKVSGYNPGTQSRTKHRDIKLDIYEIQSKIFQRSYGSGKHKTKTQNKESSVIGKMKKARQYKKPDDKISDREKSVIRCNKKSSESKKQKSFSISMKSSFSHPQRRKKEIFHNKSYNCKGKYEFYILRWHNMKQICSKESSKSCNCHHIPHPFLYFFFSQKHQEKPDFAS